MSTASPDNPEARYEVFASGIKAPIAIEKRWGDAENIARDYAKAYGCNTFVRRSELIAITEIIQNDYHSNRIRLVVRR